VYHLELTPKSDEEMNIFYEEDGVKWNIVDKERETLGLTFKK
jgi:hypothetical protein